MSTVIVQLLLKDRLLQELPFAGDALSIGRMKENDVVINNLSVSRFHAVLRRDGDGFVLEDKGSENGTFVNGERASDPLRVEPGDEVRVGKHKIVLRSAEGELDAATPERGASDVWDSAQTYFAGPETLAKLDDAPQQSGFLETDDILSSFEGQVDVLSQTDSGAPTGNAEEPLESADEFAIASEEDRPEGELVALGPDLEESDLEAEIATELIDDGIGDALSADEPLFAEAISEPESHGPPSSEVAADPLLDMMDVPSAGPVLEGLDAPAAGALLEPQDDLGVDPVLGDLSPDEGPLAGFDVDAAAPASPPEQTSFFAFGTEPGEASSPGLAPQGEELSGSEPLEAPAAASEPEPRYAGLIVQRAGQLERVLAWEQEELCAGRAAECEVFLGSAEISRRHALFVREGDHFEVRDLDSINGVEVNGEIVRSAILAVGDVIRIEDYEITFVLDAHPVGEEVQTTDASAAERESEASFGMTQLHEGVTANPALGLTPSPAQVDLLAEDDDEIHGIDEEKALEMGAVASVPDTALDLLAPAAIPGDLSLRIIVRREQLPDPLRRALVELGPGEVRIPVELCIAGDASDD